MLNDQCQSRSLTDQSKQVNRGCSAILLFFSWLRVMQVCFTLVLLHFAVLLVSMEGKHEPRAVVRFLASTGAMPIQIWRQLQTGCHAGSMSQKTGNGADDSPVVTPASRTNPGLEELALHGPWK